MHLYSLKYRRQNDPSGRVYRTTVIASSADEAREYIALKDPAFGSTVSSPRRGREVVPPEGDDPLTLAKTVAEIARMG